MRKNKIGDSCCSKVITILTWCVNYVTPCIIWWHHMVVSYGGIIRWYQGAPWAPWRGLNFAGPLCTTRFKRRITMRSNRKNRCLHAIDAYVLDHVWQNMELAATTDTKLLP